MSIIGRRLNDLDTPTLWVNLAIMEANIKMAAAHFASAGKQWRPHFKGIKTPAIAHKLIKAGAIGITCAKLGEAEVLVASGITDILIANQVVGAKKIERLAFLRRSADVKVAVDDPTNVSQLGAIASSMGVEIGVVVDVNTGMQRTGVQPGEPVVALSGLVHDTAGLNYLGVMAWEGHTLGHVDEAVKRAEIEKSIGYLVDSAELCRQADLPVSIVSGGGSGTMTTTPFLPGLTEIQAGGVIFSDVLYNQWGVITTPCLFVRALVTSRSASDRIVIDAGYKTLPAFHMAPRPLGIDGVKSYGASAEHGSIMLDAPNDTVKVGDTLDLMVGYTDATLFLHDELVGVRDGVVEVVWDIAARGKLK
ncbi:MAG: D-serine deaminase-like pyridoxal phosphate-dependent protein [Cellvibrionaceae bacterium]|jgi:D-serine deaminase-like pyridoxal phosphate-dependent protein